MAFGNVVWWVELLAVAFLAIASVLGLRFVEMVVHRRIGPSVPLSVRERELLKRIDQLEQELQHWRRKHEVLEHTVQILIEQLKESQVKVSGVPVTEPAEQQNTNHRVLVILSDAGGNISLAVDLAAFRAVQSRTGLRFTRLTHATKDKVERMLDRARMSGRPYKYVHFSTHANQDGVMLDDGMVDGVWLSEHLRGVEVLVLDNCESTFVGDYLGVVPYVVTMQETIANRDAMFFAQAFWEGIGQGVQPEDAFDEALVRSPTAVGEFAYLHT